MPSPADDEFVDSRPGDEAPRGGWESEREARSLTANA